MGLRRPITQRNPKIEFQPSFGFGASLFYVLLYFVKEKQCRVTYFVHSPALDSLSIHNFTKSD